MNIKQIFDYLKRMGISWILFRIKYEIRKKSGYFNKLNNIIIDKSNKIQFNKFELPKLNFNGKINNSNNEIIERADKAIKGIIYGFSSQYLDYSENNKINWQLNPKTKISAPDNIEWNKLHDFGEYGDIKLIWEASRFPQIFHFILAYNQSQNNKYAYACIRQISDWIDKNTFPFGVNYKCGQEITIRLISWIVAVNYFNEFIDEKIKQKIIKNIYTSLLRIDANIDYAVKSVKNNHSISEASGLLIGGLLFPQFPESDKWKKKGLKYLLNETAYQIYKDGSYIQHSMTYQRFVLDMLSFVILISKQKNFELPEEIIERHKKMIVFLNSFIQTNGYLPNYGSNDGAMLFPLSISNYRDFRPSINFAATLSLGGYLYEQGNELIEFFNIKTNKIELPKKTKFNTGGYYILKNKNIFLFSRCHSYKHRPSQNDMLHVDIWYKGKNIFRDSGTYSYNINKKLKENFTGVKGHNTIQINNDNYMDSVLNFGLTNWTKSILLNYSKQIFEGKHYAYIKKHRITINRKIELSDKSLIIRDLIKGVKYNVDVKQIWNSDESFIKQKENILKSDLFTIKSNINFIHETSLNSEYYNLYSKGERIIFYTNTDKNIEIETIITFN
ncbi:MAG: heparinase II/III family protein [Bacteroidales bacterium]|nr:heparinase II/III family protein [Bacteroidales bacterium]